MTREFPDELLSAFLDDELSPAERAQVEQHLARSEADRQLLAELKSLRSDVAALPTVAVTADFADRVVRAALAEAEKYNGATAGITLATPAAATRPSRKWMLRAAVASAAALAACYLLVVQPWRHNTPPASPIVQAVIPAVEEVAAIKDQFINAWQATVPGEGDAVVVRLCVSKDVPLSAALDAALSKAGIASLAAEASTSAAQWQEAYRRSLETKYRATSGTPNESLLNSTVAAAGAVFVEAPLDRLEGVLSELSAGMKQPLKLSPVGKLTLAGGSDSVAEGEPGSGQAFAQTLNASLFRLEKTLADAAVAVATPQPAGKPPKPQQRVRVLILIEAE